MQARQLDCASCGHRVERRSRQQRFCSDRCRDRGRLRMRGRTIPPESKTNASAGKVAHAPPEKAVEINGGNGPNIRGYGYVINAEIFAPHHWEERVSSGGVPIAVTQLRKSSLVRKAA